MCTSFSITSTKNHLIVARTQEFFLALTPSMFFRAKGATFKQDVEADVERLAYIFGGSKEGSETIDAVDNLPTAEQLMEWSSRYDFIAMSDESKQFIVDGVNSEGLTTGMMTLTLSKYQSLEQEQYANTIMFPYLPCWILSNCKNCQDVIDKLEHAKVNLSKESQKRLYVSTSSDKKIRVCNPFATVPAAIISHFPVRDREGNAIVLEYINGELIISDLNPYGVVTNDPQIAFHQQNLTNNFSEVTPFIPQSVIHSYEEGSDNYDITPPTYPATRFNCKGSVAGSGFSSIPGGSAPVDRFIRTAMMVNYALPTNCAEEAMNLAYHIANTVDIPLGTSRKQINSTKESGIDSTVFVTVCDLNDLTYTIRAYDSPAVFKISFSELDFKGLNGKTFVVPTKEYKCFDITTDINNLVTEQTSSSIQA